MSKFRFLALAFSLVAMSACAPSTSIRHSADFATKLSKNPTLSILPTKAAVVELDAANSTTRMYDYEGFIEPIVQEVLIEALTSKEYNTKKVYPSDLKKNALYKDVDKINQKSASAASMMHTKYSSKSPEAFNTNENIGDTARNFYKKTGQRILIISKYGEMSKTNGARVKDFLMDGFLKTNQGANTENASLTVTIVDAKDGKALWTYSALKTDDLISAGINSAKSPENAAKSKVQKIVEMTLSKLPKKSELFSAQAEEEKFFDKK